MKSKNFRDRNLRLFFKKNEYKIKILKAIFEDLNLPKSFRYKLHFYINSLIKFASSVKIKNRCLITGRSKSVLKNIHISRLMFRKMVSEGNLPGIKKSS